MKDKLTPRQKKFKDKYTDDKDMLTFGNGVQSVMQSYNVKNANVAGVMANELLSIPKVANAIEQKILKKEELQTKQGNLVEKLESFVNENGITVENVSIINQLGINIERNAKLNGDLIDRIESIGINIDIKDSDVLDRLKELYT